MYQMAKNTHPSNEIPPRDVTESEVENVVQSLQIMTKRIFEQLARFIHLVDQIQFIGRKPITLKDLTCVEAELPMECNSITNSSNSAKYHFDDH